MQTAQILVGVSTYEKPDIKFAYGTAGFRLPAEQLPSVMFRCGILASLRSYSYKTPTVVGAMVTASHNPPRDNGIKIVDGKGEMLAEKWETYAHQLANSADLIKDINSICHAEQLCRLVPDSTCATCPVLLNKSLVIVGRDTRPSGETLVAAFTDGVNSMSGNVHDYGILTTPQLHYLTKCKNDSEYGEPTIDGYNTKLSDAFNSLMATNGSFEKIKIKVDCANGVGAPAMVPFQKIKNGAEFELLNVGIDNANLLNLNCGADYVKTQQKAPDGVVVNVGDLWCSFDGDADRIVFFYSDQAKVFRLLDGDKIATIAASFLASLLAKSGITKTTNLTLGIIQTAYANGSSTKYIKNQLACPVVFTKTGVKYLHHAAQSFDIGVYFEANGHGTIVFSDRAIAAFSLSSQDETEHSARTTLVLLNSLVNQCVGDAISDLLLITTILIHTGTNAEIWNSAYTDLPCLIAKIRVADRMIFKPNADDTRIVDPSALQNEIDKIVIEYTDARCFVRPSGTEDVVRVYAEAKNRKDAEECCYRVCGMVFDCYGGVGARPDEFLGSF